ncbi:MAG: transglycosylase domain-containing protein [Alphaproteobacteria bacterium]
MLTVTREDRILSTSTVLEEDHRAKQSPRGRRSTAANLVTCRTVILVFLGLGGLVAMMALGGLVWCVHDLPTMPKPAAARSSITLLARDGKVFAETGDQYGETLAPDGLPPNVVAAVIATEDRRFPSHPGIDPVGIGRALVENLRSGAIAQGGSTITQQLAKMLFLSPERSLKRKVQEMALALMLERQYGKAELLALYLNRAYFGAGAYGVDAAARRYFDKSAHELSLAEAAALAGALKAPSRYNLVADRDATVGRAGIVLSAMVDTGMISPAEAERARADLHNLVAKLKVPTSGWFADWAIEQVREMPVSWGRNVTVETTYDVHIQEVSEKRLETMLADVGARDKVGEGAVVVMTPEGAVRAMVGGRNHVASSFNRVVQAKRQPGSLFKTFVYLAAVGNGFSPDDTILDAPVRIGGWSPDNYLGKYRGQVNLRTAFAQSLNAPAVRLANKVGLDAVIRTARRLGVESGLRRDATLALGSSEVTLLEMAGAMATLASGGGRADIHGITEIRDNDGTVLYRHEPGEVAPVATPEVVTAMHDMMVEVVRSGTGKAAAPGRPAAGKTGTSQNYRDAWFIGFTGDLVAGVWMGNDNASPMNKVVGGKHPAALWREVMIDAHADLPVRPLRTPGVEMPADDAPIADRLRSEPYEHIGLAAEENIEADLRRITDG